MTEHPQSKDLADRRAKSRRRRAPAAVGATGLVAAIAALRAASAQEHDADPFADLPVADDLSDLLAYAEFCATRAPDARGASITHVHDAADGRNSYHRHGDQGGQDGLFASLLPDHHEDGGRHAANSSDHDGHAHGARRAAAHAGHNSGHSGHESGNGAPAVAMQEGCAQTDAIVDSPAHAAHAEHELYAAAPAPGNAHHAGHDAPAAPAASGASPLLAHTHEGTAHADPAHDAPPMPAEQKEPSPRGDATPARPVEHVAADAGHVHDSHGPVAEDLAALAASHPVI